MSATLNLSGAPVWRLYFFLTLEMITKLFKKPLAKTNRNGKQEEEKKG